MSVQGGDGNEINPMQLSLEQLNSLKTQHEEEISELGRQLEALMGAKNRFMASRATLDDIATTKSGDEMLVPLTSSLYVPGKILDPNKVIVELGTGYFCEKTVPEAKELTDRKITLVNKSIESVDAVIAQKRKNMETIVQIMQYKISMLQQQQQQQNQAKAS